MASPLTDNYGRRLEYLRLAVTDRCNLRCRYCMPAEGIVKGRKDEILTWEELQRLCRIFTEVGVAKIRITGGEPFMRRGLVSFLDDLSRISSAPEIGITTNGTLLEDYLCALKQIGVQRLNISLDTLDTATYQYLTRRRDLSRIFPAIDQACRLGFTVKINMVVIAGVNDGEIPDFVELTRNRRWTVRFIEPMPFDGLGGKHLSRISGDEILTRLRDRFDLESIPPKKSAVADLYRVAGYAGRIGIICGYLRRFCQGCSRLRLSARGEFRTCLYGQPVLDLRAMLRGGQSDRSIKGAIREAVHRRFSDGFEAEKSHRLNNLHSMAAIGG